MRAPRMQGPVVVAAAPFPFASMRPRRARLGCPYPTSACALKQSGHVFEGCATATDVASGSLRSLHDVKQPRNCNSLTMIRAEAAISSSPRASKHLGKDSNDVNRDGEPRLAADLCFLALFSPLVHLTVRAGQTVVTSSPRRQWQRDHFGRAKTNPARLAH